MPDSPLQAMQLTMARYLRNPGVSPPPAGVEPRRLKIYEDLVYNNIEGFISGGFPVLRTIYQDADWHALVRAFVFQHRCHTPYFLEISQEFVRFLLEDYQRRDSDPPFLAALAHYEWVELALDISQDTLPEATLADDIANAVLCLSPLAWLLCYQYPVHRIGRAFRPQEASEPTYLAVYRNRADQVRFIELNAATARLLELIRDNRTETAAILLRRLAGELDVSQDAVLDFGEQQLREFITLSVVLVAHN
ncbi:MAG: putative DNA-binding domain-containing protein [Halioglobus sp.]